MTATQIKAHLLAYGLLVKGAAADYRKVVRETAVRFCAASLPNLPLDDKVLLDGEEVARDKIKVKFKAKLKPETLSDGGHDEFEPWPKSTTRWTTSW